MDFNLQWLLIAFPVAFALGWIASRFDFRQWQREQQSAPKAYFKGLNLLLNEQQDKAIDAFIEAVQNDPDTTELHFALGNLFRRRGEYERAVRVHQHVLMRGDLPRAERDKAQYALAQDFVKAGLFDRAEDAFKALLGTPFQAEAQLALLTLYERSREWKSAIDMARQLESVGTASFANRISHFWCEIALASAVDAERMHALQQAQKSAPQSARAKVEMGREWLRLGQLANAQASFVALAQLHPDAFNLVADEYAQCALKLGDELGAATHIKTQYALNPTMDLVLAQDTLEGAPSSARLLEHLQHRSSLWASSRLLKQTDTGLAEPLRAALVQSTEKATRPLLRYRCAACGFEAQNYFWQCPGCLGWDTYPPLRLEDEA